MSHGRGQGALLAFLAIALAVLLAACGGGGGGSIAPRPPATLNITTTSLNDGVTNQAYSQTLQASGGTGARTWSLSAGSLPTGLSLNASTGAITGTPTATGAFNFTVRVQDSGTPQQSDTQALTIRIADPLSITTPSLPNAAEDDTTYAGTVQVSGGIAPYTWSITAGSLPTGLSLNGSTTNTLGFTGDPTAGGVFTFTVQVTDSTNPQQPAATKQFTVRILQITTIGLPDGVENDLYGGGPFTFLGAVGPLTWSEPTTSFSDSTGAGAVATPCEGLTFNFPARTITGTPVNPGTCGPFTARATDIDSRFDDQSLSITIAADLMITTTSLPGGTTGTAYNQAVSATGGTSPFTWSEPTAFFDADTGEGTTGTDCEGLGLDLTATGNTSISGTPVNPGICAFTLRVDDSGVPAQFDEQVLSITVNPGILVITTTALAPGAVNRSYTATAEASGGTPPFTWSEPTGSFDAGGIGAPATPCEGLTLDFATGTISGIPAVQGTCGPFTLQVDDSGAQTDTQTGLSIVIEPEPVALGRNDSIADATPLSSGIFSASISPYADPVDTANPDTDFYEVTANAGATVTVEVTARGLIPPTKLDPVVEIVDASGTRFATGCRNEGNYDGLGLDFNPDGTRNPDPTPLAFDDPCINDDIQVGVNRDSKLEFQVPGASGTVTFYLHVLDWRGDARPDLRYELRIQGAN